MLIIWLLDGVYDSWKQKYLTKFNTKSLSGQSVVYILRAPQVGFEIVSPAGPV